jgi:hypothetical protein
MITLNENIDYWIMLAIVAGFGGFGGLVYDLLQARGGNTGMLEFLGRRERNRYFDLGWIASILVGAAAAIAVLYIFPPTITIEEGKNATTQYDLVALIALSVIVGSAGPSILEMAQQRVKAAVNAREAQTKTSEGQVQVEQVGTVIAPVQAESAMREVLSKRVQPLLTNNVPPAPTAEESGTSADEKSPQEVIDEAVREAVESFSERMKQPISTAKRALISSPEPPSE